MDESTRGRGGSRSRNADDLIFYWRETSLGRVSAGFGIRRHNSLSVYGTRSTTKSVRGIVSKY